MFLFSGKICYNYSMKKFNRTIHKNMGALPDALRQMAGGDVRAATDEFNAFMTTLATDFHAQLADGVDKNNIVLTAPGKLFGHDVKLDYVASGSVGSVYKMQIGDQTFAFKINRNSAHGELGVMNLQKHARGLVNKTHIGAVFEYDGRKYSWVLSDYISHDRENGFESAMEKMYYMYLTHGLTVTDAHPNNFIDGKLIDTPSLRRRDGKIDDIKRLTRIEQNMVARLAYCIKTNDLKTFQQLVAIARAKNPAVINYMFLAMRFGRPALFAVGKMNDFAQRLKKFESIIDTAYRANKQSMGHTR